MCILHSPLGRSYFKKVRVYANGFLMLRHSQHLDDKSIKMSLQFTCEIVITCIYTTQWNCANRDRGSRIQWKGHKTNIINQSNVRITHSLAVFHNGHCLCLPSIGWLLKMTICFIAISNQSPNNITSIFKIHHCLHSLYWYIMLKTETHMHVFDL